MVHKKMPFKATVEEGWGRTKKKHRELQTIDLNIFLMYTYLQETYGFCHSKYILDMDIRRMNGRRKMTNTYPFHTK